MLYSDYNSSIRDIFKQVEGVSQDGLEALFDDEVRAGTKSYAEAVIDAGIAEREDILSLVSEYLGYELQIGAVGEIDLETLKVIDAEMAHQYGIVPLYLSEGGIHFLTSDPFNSAIIDDLTFALNMEIFLVVCDPLEIEQLLEKHYSREQTSLDNLIGEAGLDGFEDLDETKESDLTDAANETPIIRFVNLVMQQAIRPRLRIFTLSRSRRNSRSDTVWTGLFMRCLLHPRVWPCPSFRELR